MLSLIEFLLYVLCKKIMNFAGGERGTLPNFDVNLIILNFDKFWIRPLTVESLHRVSPPPRGHCDSLKSRPNTKCLNLEMVICAVEIVWGHVKRHDKLQLAIKNKKVSSEVSGIA